MARTRNHILLLIALCLPLWAVSQSPNKWTARADEARQAGEYQEAIELYLFALKQDTSWEAQAGLARCYFRMRKYEEARTWFSSALKRPGAPPELFFFYGQTLQTTGDYPAAESAFLEYARRTGRDKAASAFTGLAGLLSEWKKDSVGWKAERLPFNSSASDFAPLPYGDGLLFSSNRLSGGAVRYRSHRDGSALSDVWIARRKEKGDGWRRPEKVNGLSSKWNDIPAAFSAGGDSLYLTRNMQASKGKARFAIFRAIRNGQDWKTDKSPVLYMSGQDVACPTFSPDGKLCIFSADIPGGFGGSDLYLVILENGIWTSPLNLGPGINTPGDESYPFLHPDGRLFFSSNGWPGFGGLDIFEASLSEKAWQFDRNLGPPFNSHSDDFGFYLDAENESGYFNSGREGSDDIFAFSLSMPVFECQPQQEYRNCFRFWEENAMQIDSMPLSFEWDMGDGTKYEGLEVNHCFPGPGTYIVQLNLIDTVSGFVFLNQATYEFVVKGGSAIQIEGPEHVRPGDTVTFSALVADTLQYRPSDIYWDLGTGRIHRGPEVEAVFNAESRPVLRLGIQAVGADSLQRNLCVTRPLRVSFKDSGPVDTAPQEALRVRDLSKPQFYLPDTPQVSFRVQLMRSPKPLPADSVFKGLKDIVEVLDKGAYLYTYGNAPSIEDIYPRYVEALQSGYRDALVVAFHDGHAVSGNDSSFYANRIHSTLLHLNLLVTDVAGKPVKARISWQDLITGSELGEQETDVSGKLRVPLPDGILVGYAVEAGGKYPYANHIDLRTQVAGSRVFRDTIVLYSTEELLLNDAALRINNLFFDTGKDMIRPESEPELRRLAAWLKAEPQLTVTITGHTDNQGNPDYNLQLSRRRAAMVKQKLEAYGLDSSRLISDGKGETEPVRSNSTPEGRAFNRRVEIRVSR